MFFFFLRTNQLEDNYTLLLAQPAESSVTVRSTEFGVCQWILDMREFDNFSSDIFSFSRKIIY